MPVADKQKAHELIDRMPAEEMPAVVEWLRSRIEEADDEPVTEQDLQRLRELRAALDRGEKGTPMEEFLAEFGWTLGDLRLQVTGTDKVEVDTETLAAVDRGI